MLSPRLTILLLAVLATSCKAQQQQQQEGEQLVASESSPQIQAAEAKPAQLKQVLTELVNNAYQLGQASKAYLDTQPEFAQAWADFPYAPGYLPGAFRVSHTPYQLQQSQYKAQGGASNQNSIGYGYIDFSGPVNPAVLYVPVSLPYYYRVPPQSAFYLPQQSVYPPLLKQVYQPAPQLVAQVKPTVYAAKSPVYVSSKF